MNKQSSAIVVAGLAGGSGKSVVAVGLTAALAKSGKKVVPFKKGPDYIDAGWLQLAAGSNCYNLDPYLVDQQILENSFYHHAAGSDIALIEGNRGLYDGVNPEGSYSTAELAVAPGVAVLLVVNCTKTTRTVAAMVLGCCKFDERLDIRGVVLNQVATERQRRLVTEAVERYTGIPVVGAIPRMSRDIFPMRHLGMTPYQEYSDSQDALMYLVETVEENLDLQKIESLLKPLQFPQTQYQPPASETASEQRVRIGIIQDAAFQFYYPDNIEALRREGAEIVRINALTDTVLPDLDGLYIGGGFPETSAKALAANSGFRQSLKAAADAGLPIYAECGGLIYLGESITIEGEEYMLAGVFPARFGMSKKPQAHGYSTFIVENENPFYAVGLEVKGHEFRYSTVLAYGWDEESMALAMQRGTGFLNGRDGLVYNNVLATYTHVHAGGTRSGPGGWWPVAAGAAKANARVSCRGLCV